MIANISDTILVTYLLETTRWSSVIQTAALGLMGMLIVIELAWSGVSLMLGHQALTDAFSEWLRKIVVFGFVFLFIFHADQFVYPFIDGFITLANRATGEEYLLPSYLLTEVAALYDYFMADKSLVAGLGYLVVGICMALVAGQLMVTLIEGYIVTTAGIILMAFSVTRWTSSFLYLYINYLLAFAAKLFLYYLIIGGAVSMVEYWKISLQLGSNGAIAEAVVSAIVFLAVVFGIPKLAHALTSGSVADLTSSVVAAGVKSIGAAALATKLLPKFTK